MFDKGADDDSPAFVVGGVLSAAKGPALGDLRLVLALSGSAECALLSCGSVSDLNERKGMV